MTIDIAIMIEGQDGLTWERWKRLAGAVESLGFAGLFRSDHYTNAKPPDDDSLELWVSMTWLADHSSRLAFGPLVTPVSFRHPTMTARMARDVDDLSGGRLVLGLGAGWQEREHENYGWDLLPVPERFERFEEGLEVITRLFEQPEGADFDGEHYQLREAALLPPPSRPGGPPILIGGNGMKRTLPLAARYADEWNGVYLTPDRLRERNLRLDELLAAQGREPAEVRRSVMVGCEYGRSEAEVEELALGRAESVQALREIGALVGTAPEIVDQIGALDEAGADRLMLQWLDMDAMDRLEDLAQRVLPQFQDGPARK